MPRRARPCVLSWCLCKAVGVPRSPDGGLIRRHALTDNPASPTAMPKGFVCIPKSVKPVRMKENMAIFDFELDADDMTELDGLTTPEAIDKFAELYRKCVVRDTPVPIEQAKTTFTRG